MRYLKWIAAGLAALLLAGGLAACKPDDGGDTLENLATTVRYTQSFTEAGLTAPAGDANGLIAVDNSWTGNYTLTYSYSENGTLSRLTERRCEGLYSVTDEESGVVSFFIQEGDRIEQYMLDPTGKVGTHAALEGQNLSGISTGFMRIAAVNPAFPTYANVEYQGDETVNGRPARKYTQQAYNDAGLLTAYAFVWIDTQYGFASKCQVFNLTGEVNTTWELRSIEVGAVTPESIGFSTDGYTITEAEQPEED